MYLNRLGSESFQRAIPPIFVVRRIFTASIQRTEKSEKLRFGKTTALLLTIVFMAFYYYGLRAVAVAGVSCFASIFSDYIASCARRIKYDWTDLSPVMSGLLLALLMPAAVPYTVMAFASVFMSLVCKNAFGGNKNLIFCPVCISYIFTTFCFPSYVLRYPTPVPFGKLPMSNIVTESLGYSYTNALDNGAASAFSLLDIIWGKLAGPMGASASVIILIAGISLYLFGDLPPAAFFAGFGANVLINVVFPVGEPGWYAVLNSQVAGSFLFVLVFMACDLRYVPKRMFSQLLYGVLFALGSYYIRKYTVIENAAIFALPLLCMLKDEFDRLTDALERLLRFIWKWLKIGAAGFVRQTGALIDRISSYIARKLVESSKKREERIMAARGETREKEPENQDGQASVTVREIKIIDEENAAEETSEDDMSTEAEDER